MADNDTKNETKISDHPDYRSRDELENLYFAVLDTVWRSKDWGRLDPEVPATEERMAEAKAIAEAVMLQWGLKAEEAQLDQASAHTEGEVQVTTGYGALSKRPFVQVYCDGQLRPELARSLAVWLNDAAAVAEQDAILVRWAEERLEVDEERAAALMQDMRGYREQLRGADVSEDGSVDAVPLTELRTRGVRRMGGRTS
jgi:hypothetical protein